MQSLVYFFSIVIIGFFACSLNLIYTTLSHRSSCNPKQKPRPKKKKKSNLTRQQANIYGKIIKGLHCQKHRKKVVRLMTLTTSNKCYKRNGDRLTPDCQKLNQRIKRMTPYKMYKKGYIKHLSRIRRYYPNMKICEKFKMEYFKAPTEEGNGTIHLLYTDFFLPPRYVADIWEEIHLSREINIKKIDISTQKSIKRLAGYLVNQYITKRDIKKAKSIKPHKVGLALKRTSNSWKWIWRGWSTDWHNFLNINAKQTGVVLQNEWGWYFTPWKDDYDFNEGWEQCMFNHFHPPFEKKYLFHNQPKQTRQISLYGEYPYNILG